MNDSRKGKFSFRTNTSTKYFPYWDSRYQHQQKSFDIKDYKDSIKGNNNSDNIGMGSTLNSNGDIQTLHKEREDLIEYNNRLDIWR